jgi:hypothetical protein
MNRPNPLRNARPSGLLKHGADISQAQQQQRTIAAGSDRRQREQPRTPGYDLSVLRVRRAAIGPGLRPGPRRQARWVGRGLRRSRVGPEDRFCEAVRNELRVPLTLEGSTRRMRGPAPAAVTFSRLPAQPTRARRPGRGAGGRGSGIRRGPQAAGHTGCRARQPPRCRACVRRTRRSCRPTTASPPGEPGRLRRVTWPLIPSRSLAPILAVHDQAVRPRAPKACP